MGTGSRALNRWAIAAVVATTIATGTVASTTPRYRIRTEHVARGMTLEKILDRHGPNRIRVLKVDPSTRLTFDVALATGKLPGHETTSSMARRHNAIAAINGDFTIRPGLTGAGRPVNTFLEDGHLKASPLIWGRNFSISRDESTARVGHSRLDMWLSQPTGELWDIASVNPVHPDPSGFTMYTPAGGRSFRPPRRACSARLFPYGKPGWNGDFEGLSRDFVVDRVTCRWRRMKRWGGHVLTAPIGSASATTLRTGLVPGEVVGYGWSFHRAGVLDTIGGNPDLVRNGRLISDCAGAEFCARHPRSGVGITADGHILLVTVDGRMRSSVGMTPDEFGKLFIYLGAKSAMNLDGGGSTTMVVRGRIRNVPSGGYERAVGSSLLVLGGRDRRESEPGPYATPIPIPTPSSTPAPTPSSAVTPSPSPSLTPTVVSFRAATWGTGSGEVVESACPARLDPASTGGMLDAVAIGALGDRKLPPSLRWAVRVFRAGDLCR